MLLTCSPLIVCACLKCKGPQMCLCTPAPLLRRPIATAHLQCSASGLACAMKARLTMGALQSELMLTLGHLISSPEGPDLPVYTTKQPLACAPGHTLAIASILQSQLLLLGADYRSVCACINPRNKLWTHPEFAGVWRLLRHAGRVGAHVTHQAPRYILCRVLELPTLIAICV